MKKLVTAALSFLFIIYFHSACDKFRGISKKESADIILIGGGIMSATVGSLLKDLQPNEKMIFLERMPKVALESSMVWNNAGTGHAAYCELNYTPEQPNGTIDIQKAIKINQEFELSKQYWAYLVKMGFLKNPKNFINSVDHMSFVIGQDDVNFLKKRYLAMKEIPLFEQMEYSEDPKQIEEWIPLVMEGRDKTQKVAATKMNRGVDINFGALTTMLFDHLEKQDGVSIRMEHEVVDIKRNEENGSWIVFVINKKTNERLLFEGKSVFIGAGGAALPLLQKSGIEEGKNYAGFPVGGAWLVTHNKEIVQKHNAKVYGKAAVDAPPMSVPHLDARFIEGDRALLFGPFAVFSTKFLKDGSYADILASFRYYNALPMIKAGIDNMALTKYLIGQVILSKEQKMDVLRKYFPNAKDEDFTYEIAGQRVQIIKREGDLGGRLQFGTEVVLSKDKSLSALLGASPGASTSVKIAIDIVKGMKPSIFEKDEYAKEKLKEIFPSLGKDLSKDRETFEKVKEITKIYLETAY